jgi:REP element-mobilizing transposase RayT
MSKRQQESKRFDNIPEPSGTGFEPRNPWSAQDVLASRRNLPHIQVHDATYFITFRCCEGVSLPESVREIVLSAMRFWHGRRIFLDAAIVMPDHAHAILRITDNSTLSQILHSIKSYSANQINKQLSRQGPIWQDESFDHILRSEAEWEEKLQYVRENPVVAGLVEESSQYRWLWP